VIGIGCKQDSDSVLVPSTKQEVAASSLTVMRLVFWPVSTEEYRRTLTTMFGIVAMIATPLQGNSKKVEDSLLHLCCSSTTRFPGHIRVTSQTILYRKLYRSMLQVTISHTFVSVINGSQAFRGLIDGLAVDHQHKRNIIPCFLSCSS
jgi:hypothetical protein